MAFDPSTLDPEEIRQIPVDRSKPLNGLTEEQVRAIGADPEFVEQARLEANAFAETKALEEDAALIVAAQQAVEDGEMTEAEAALGLAQSGRSRAHDVFVERWLAAENANAAIEAAEEAAWETPFLDAQEYAALQASRKALERAQLEQQRDETQRELEIEKVQALQEHVDSFVESTPGAYAIKPEVEQRIIERIRSTGSLPSTPAERNALIESVVTEWQVLGTAAEEIKQQVETEYRILRKERGARDGLMTKAEIDAQAQHYKRERFNQLAEAKQIDVAALEPGPSAEDESAALAAKYRDKQARSTSFHQQVADIAGRGSASSGDRGQIFTDEKRRYKEAYARAESEAAYGPDAQIKSGYGADAIQVGAARSTGYGPDGTWPDELGPAV